MGLQEVYEAKFGGEKAAAEKKAEGEEVAAEATADATAATAEATSEEGKAEPSDAEVDKALEGMTDEQLQELAVEVASDVKESQAKDTAENEKLADEYFAAGRIFAQGFMAETNGKTAADAKKTNLQKFAGLLKAQMEKAAEKTPEKATK